MIKKEIITFKDPKSPISEIFRTLRTNVQFANTKRGLHSLLITSTSPGEGKSWISANLAVAFAQAGKKVILVDCDMRKGRQFSIFNVSPTPGLSNFLSGINSNGEESSPNILSYIKETEVENLYIITAGNIPPNPSELLVSEQMLQSVEELKSICDLVIFDGTPSCLVTDAVIMSRYVDTTLIVSAYKTTKMDDLEKVKRDIENVGGKVAGVVINKMPVSQKQYYETYYYGNSNLKLKEDKTKKKKTTKEEQELEIERKRQELKEKSRNIIMQNKLENIKNEQNILKNEEQNNKKTEQKVEEKVQEKPKTRKPRTKKEVAKEPENDSIDASDLLKQMDEYLNAEKARIQKGDNK